MIAESINDRLWSLEARKKTGLPNELGFITCGISKLGDYNPFAGIYSKRRGARVVADRRTSVCGVIELGTNHLGVYHLKYLNRSDVRQIIVKKRFYVPANPRTETQQNWRTYFALCVSEWYTLSSTDREYWHNLKVGKPMSGWNKFLSYHLKARDL